MTVEEIEIIVTAKVEEALKEFQKIVPSIKKQLNQTQEAFSKIDTKVMKNKVNQAVQFMKKKMQDLRKSNTNNELAIKINNKEASKQISQIQKEIDSLQKKISERELKLNITNGALDKIREETRQEVMKETPDIGAKGLKQRTEYKMLTNPNSAQMIKESDKLNNEIIRYSALLNSAKGKMSELGGETTKTATTQNKLSSFFSAFKQKVGQVIPSIINMKNHFNKLPKVTQNINNNIKGMGGNLKQGLGHVLKYAGALFSIRGIYRLISGAAQSWLSSQNSGAQQLSANIEYLKYSLGSVFAPIIQWITNLVYQLMKAIQSLVYAFSGVNIFANATAKSMKNASGSAKEAGKSLAGVHTEINNISDNSNGGGTGNVTPNMDLSQMDNTTNSIIDTIKNGDWYQVGAIIGEKLNEGMNKIPWSKIQNTAKKISKGLAELLNGFIAKTDWKQVGSTFSQGLNTVIYTGQSFLSTFDFKNFGKAIGTSISSFIENIDWKALGDTLSLKIKGVFNSITGFFETFDWSVILQGLFDFITGFDWNGVSDAIFKALGSACASLLKLGMIIGDYIKQAFNGIERYFQDKIEECGGNVVAGIFKGIGDAIAGIGQWIYEHVFQPFIEAFKNAFGIHSPSTVMAEMGTYIIQGLLNGITSLVNRVNEIWQNMKNTVVNKFNEIKTSITDIWNNVKNTTLNVWNTIKDKVKEGAQGAWNGITSIFGNIPNWFKDKFTQAWQAVKNIFSTGGAIFDGIKEGILSGLKSIVNAIISGINKVISIPFNGLNSALRNIRNVDIMGLKPFNWIKSISVPQIPRLAKGGVLTEATTVIAGEYSGAKSNPEIVAPQNILRETFEDVMSNYAGNSGQPMHVTIQYLGKTIFDDTIDYINSKTRRTGKNTIVTVGD